jgi:hypothetical protein
MNQQTWIAVSLLVGFVVFITLRGELNGYLATIGFGEGGVTPQTATQVPHAPITPLPGTF